MRASSHPTNAGEGDREGSLGGSATPSWASSLGTSYVTVATGKVSLSQRGFLRLVTNQILSILGPSALEGGATQLTCLGL